MRNKHYPGSPPLAIGAAVVALSAVLAGPLASIAVADGGGPALRSGFGAQLPPRSNAAPLRQHHAQLTISHSDRLPQSKSVTLGRNKSMLVELPRNLRDVIVSDPEVVDAVVQTSNRVYLIGKKIGQANAFFFDEYGERVLTLDIGVEVDMTPLQQILTRLIPGSDIKVEALNDTIILTGSVRSPADSNRASDIASRFAVTSDPTAEARQPLKVINLVAVEGEEQVMLRVTVAEVQREVLKQLGINLGAAINAGNFSTQVLTDNALPVTGNLLSTATRIGIETAATGGACAVAGLCTFGLNPAANETAFNNSGVTGQWRSGGNALAGAIKSLERTGLIKTLAEPNLTTVSGETARFLSGGQFPFTTRDKDGNFITEYKDFGVGLSFTPNVMSEGRVSLKISTEVSELSGGATVTGAFVIKTRRADTVVELPSGGSLAIAGLVSEDTRQNIDGLPGLKNLPILGTLFRSTDYLKRETELVVIVTPYVVRPTARQNLSRAGDGLLPATQEKQTFLGHLNRIYSRGEPQNGGFKGDYGFIVE
ncbi:MAG: type II and III secretion system protein family protein [Hyphomicrobiaceae bacterium]